MKNRFGLTLNWFLLISLVTASCSGLPGQVTPTPIVPTPTFLQQAASPAIVETDPPLGSVIGHRSPITLYFNQAMNKASVESAFRGLPEGTFTWLDEATLVFTPIESYPPNAKLNITIADSIQSATGIGIAQPIELAFTVADFLRLTNLLPKADASDVNVDAAIVASFNQPIVPLGDASNQPPAFSLQPPVKGNGEWINTSTYIFYPESSLAGGAEYTVSVNPALKTVTGVGVEGGDGLTWKFVTARPRVVALNPPTETPIAIDAAITLTFNQPMDPESVQANFQLSGNDGPVDGTFTWNDDGSELTFKPEALLARGVGYLLNLKAETKSRGGTALGEEYGAALNTIPDFAVTGTEPNPWVTTFFFSSPIAEGEYDDAVTVTPAIENFDVGVSLYDTGTNLYVSGIYLPDTNYVIELAGTIKDQWGQALGDPYVLNFRTPPLAPALNYQWISNAVFVRPDNPVLYANATNIQTADVTVEPVSLQDFFLLMNSYETLKAYEPKNATTYSQSFDLPPNTVEPVGLNLAPPESRLSSGVYYVDVTSPQITNAQGSAAASVRSRQADPAPQRGGGGGGIGVDFVVSSQVNLTFKRSAKEALVWAVDLPSQKPVAKAPVVIYDGTGNVLASGTTDENGLWQGAINPPEGQLYAVLGEPGNENFAVALHTWNFGFNAWYFGYSQNLEPPHTEIYLYTDRPIYRPGQTVYFRGVARQAFNGRYELPPLNEITLNLMGWNGTQLSTIQANLSPYGTFNGEIELPEDAVPGYYTLQNESLGFYFSFEVAEYRKPEINLSVDFADDDIKLGDSTNATVDAQYFFGAPAGDVDVTWTISAQPEYFYLPGFQTGLLSTSWHYNSTPWVDLGTDGEQMGQTTPQGKLSIPLPAVPESEAGQVVTLEATVQDESGFPVSARSEVRVHPAEFYIGLAPDSWIGTSKSAMGFDVRTVDWERNPSGDNPLVAEFKQVRWEKERDEFGFTRYTPVYTPISSSNLATGPDGKARLSFVPPTAGTFMLDVAGGGTRSQTLIWVGGPGTAAWPELEDNKLQLTAGKESYNPGETATVFIPNPFGTNSLALVTVERGIVFKSEVVTLSGSGRQYSLPVGEEDAPNVYVTVTVLGQGNEFRHGIVNLPVAADAFDLNVKVVSTPEQAGPREDVTFDVEVTDTQGQPVEGEFSLSVVDLAVLALADPNARDIFSTYYSIQPLGIETSISLAALSEPKPGGVGGGGGGGDGGISVLREDFPDTAYWNPSLITNSEGRGQVTITLPDSLTTWQVDVRGLTVDTKVGEAETQIVSSKPLLVRPVTPRFLVAGDHALLAAVINNNTENKITASVTLQSEGFVLDEPGQAAQQVDIPANGRTRVEWWGTAPLAESADLIFSATAKGNPSLQDSTRPVWGKLPILQYTSPQAFVTGGALRGAITQQEVISLPRTFTPTSGGLEVEFSPSLAGNLTSALEAMPKPDENSAEAIVSYIVPNAEVYRALSAAGLNDPKLVDRVEADLNSSVSRLFYLQNEDGGWNWWGKTIPSGGRGGGGLDSSNFTRLFDRQNGDGGLNLPGRASLFGGGGGGGSDPYISAYVFFGLLRAREAGAPMNEEALQRAGSYLRTLKPGITASTDAKALDRIAFTQFALAHAGTFDETTINQLYDARDRMNPSGIALLAFTLKRSNAADTRARDLLSNLESSAILSSSGAHWEARGEDFFTRDSTIHTTSMVIYTLAQIDAGSPVLSNAVRYLAAHRNANRMWNIGHDNAWAILALNAAMVGTGEVRADFAFDAALNGGPLTSGDIAGIQVTPITATVPLEFLSPNSPNLLTIHREDGLGRLYYNAILRLNRPVEDVKPLDKGMQIERVFLDSDCVAVSRKPAQRPARSCPPLSSFKIDPNKLITAQLTLTLPHDAYHVMVEDFIPAGSEIVNQNLKTSQQAVEATGVQVQFDEEDPFADGWGWWLFNDPQIRDESILFTADYLPAGTYVLTYTLTPLQAGEYRVLPAHAWQAFFPEVQGTSAGMVFEIEPKKPVAHSRYLIYNHVHMAITHSAVTISRLRHPQTIPAGLKISVGKSLRPAIQKIVEELNPEKIVLFGSYAYGEPNRHSDVDLLVVLNTRASQSERSWQVSRLLLPRPFPVDILVKTPKEIEKALKSGDFFLREILTRGKILYERNK